MKDFKTFRDSLVSSLVSLTRSAKYLTPSEVAFWRSDLQIAKSLDDTAAKLLASINHLAVLGSGNDKLVLFDGIESQLDENFNLAVDLFDDIFEKTVIALINRRIFY